MLFPLLPSQAPALPATYHIDTSEQYRVFEVLENDVKPDDDYLFHGKPFDGSPVTVKFLCPLGYVGSKSEENRTYKDQLVRKIVIKLDGKVLPFVAKPKAGDTLFWCLDRMAEGDNDVVAIRFTPPAGSTSAGRLRVELSLTRVVRALKEGAATGGEPGFDLSDRLKAAYGDPVTQSVKRKDYDLDKIRADLARQKDRLAWTPAEPTLAAIERFASYFATQTHYTSGATHNIDEVFDPARSLGDCNVFSAGWVEGRRLQGGVVRLIGGREAGSQDGHAVVQEYDPKLRTFILLGPSGCTVGALKPNRPLLTQLHNSVDRHFIAFQAQWDGGITDNISVIDREKPKHLRRFVNECGAWRICYKGPVGGRMFPTSVKGESRFERIGPTDPDYVTYR